jgi:5-formyltetrahydrofolate cyclo-ligase
MFRSGKGYGEKASVFGYVCGLKVLIVVALALKAQLVEEGRIPMTESDRKMDAIIVDGEVLTKER